MNASQQHVWRLALQLHPQGQRRTFDELALSLNGRNCRTTYGARYQGGRGVARLVDATYHRLVALNQRADARMVAEAFTDRNGNYPYLR